MNEKLNISGFEVSKTSPNKLFPHQPDSFYVSEAVKDTLDSESITEIQKNIIECVIGLQHESEFIALGGILQEVQAMDLLLKTTTFKIRTDLTEARNLFTKFLSGKSIDVIKVLFNSDVLNVSGQLTSVQLTELDYQRNLANITLAFENKYLNEL